MTPEAFTKLVIAELRTRDAEMPFDAALELVSANWPPNGPQVSAREVVDMWIMVHLGASMNEAGWRAAVDPAPMLSRIRFFTFTRELTLFGCACCRRIWELLPGEPFWRVVEATEKFINGNLGKEDLDEAFTRASDLYSNLVRAYDAARVAGNITEASDIAVSRHAAGAAMGLDEHGYYAAANASLATALARVASDFGPAYDAERRAQAELLREVFDKPGGPWRALGGNLNLLFIEPNQPASPTPLIDHITRKMCAAFRSARLSDYAYGGVHICACGAVSMSTDYFLPNGDMTNSLCVHYLAHHRAEVPFDHIDRIEAFVWGDERDVQLQPFVF